MQALGIDVWDGTPAQVANYAAGGGRNITYPLGLQGGSVATTWGVDRSSYAIVDSLGVVQFITANATPYTLRYAQNEANLIATLEHLTVVEQVGGNPPGGYVLAQNYPNPFSASTTIPFAVPAEARPVHVRVAVFNLLGEEVRTLVSRHLSGGQFNAQWDGRDANEHVLPNGIYFCKLEANTLIMIKRMVLLR